MRRIALFEDHGTDQLTPIALLRPVFELLCGHFSLRERLIRSLQVNQWGVFIRPELTEVYAEEHPEALINDLSWTRDEPTLYLNGRWLVEPAVVANLKVGSVGWSGDTLLYAYLPAGDNALTAENLYDDLIAAAFPYQSHDVSGTIINYPWDLFAENPKWLMHDFEHRSQQHRGPFLNPHVAIVGPEDQVYIDATATVDPYVVIDTTHGPVWIDSGAKIQAFTRLEGPCFIGRETQLFRANIREGCSIGPVCRVGGEIEESIIHGYANKYHDGFLGHSYICPWVNLGALTTNSDLKNDYSNVKVPLAGISTETRSTKVGCFIGDHTKTALCSLFNTGTAVGVMSLILPGGELLPKHVPSFSRVWHGRLEDLPDGTISALATARYAMGRRNQELTDAMERLLQLTYEQTTYERTIAFQRQADRVRDTIPAPDPPPMIIRD